MLNDNSYIYLILYILVNNWMIVKSLRWTLLMFIVKYESHWAVWETVSAVIKREDVVSVFVLDGHRFNLVYMYMYFYVNYT